LVVKKNRAPQFWLFPVVSGLIFLGVWYGLRAVLHVSEWLLPMPHEILAAMWKERERLLPAAIETAVGALGGFALAGLTGVGLAFLLGLSRGLRAGLYPWLLVLQMTPVIVLTPIIMLWAGPGTPGVITITWLISFFPIVVNTTQGLLATDMNHVALFRMCNASRVQEMLYLRMPSALPPLLAGLRIAATLAPVGAIFGEFMVGNSSGGSGGLGFLVYTYNTRLMIPAVFATGLASCLLGFIFVAAVSWLNWAMLHRWHDSFEQSDH
jgi:NitT/TauT family transport system permease protein